jgi:hypothetical protein
MINSTFPAKLSQMQRGDHMGASRLSGFSAGRGKSAAFPWHPLLRITAKGPPWGLAHGRRPCGGGLSAHQYVAGPKRCIQAANYGNFASKLPLGRPLPHV